MTGSFGFVTTMLIIVAVVAGAVHLLADGATLAVGGGSAAKAHDPRAHVRLTLVARAHRAANERVLAIHPQAEGVEAWGETLDNEGELA